MVEDHYALVVSRIDRLAHAHRSRRNGLWDEPRHLDDLSIAREATRGVEGCRHPLTCATRKRYGSPEEQRVHCSTRVNRAREKAIQEQRDGAHELLPRK